MCKSRPSRWSATYKWPATTKSCLNICDLWLGTGEGMRNHKIILRGNGGTNSNRTNLIVVSRRIQHICFLMDCREARSFAVSHITYVKHPKTFQDVPQELTILTICYIEMVLILSKLPVRQWTQLKQSPDFTMFSKLPVRQWTNEVIWYCT